MELSVLIPCATDLRIASCIDSIDESVEVVVALNGASPEVRALLRKYEGALKICEIPEPNIGAALNAGIHCATFERILKMDSDCVFAPGTIRLLYDALDSNLIAKGRMVFTSTGYLSRIVARAREYTTSDTLKTYPPLAFRKALIECIGYYFDEDVRWTEDADLNRRVRAAGIPVAYVPQSQVFHAPLHVWTDLKRAYCYGTGRKIAEAKGLAGIRSPYRLALGNLADQFKDIRCRKGLAAALYLTIWQLAFAYGHRRQGTGYLKEKSCSIDQNLGWFTGGPRNGRSN